MTKTTTRPISSLRLAAVDTGDAGMPGSGASQHTCEISVLRCGKYRAEGIISTGSNQGYYQENYSYGPWAARGDSPADAVKRLMAIVPAEHRDDVRVAAAAAVDSLPDDCSWSAAALREADRLAGLSRAYEGERKLTVGGVYWGYCGADERNDLIDGLVTRLRRMARPALRDMASVSDDALLAECRHRGLID